MKKRYAVVLIPSLLLVAIIAALIFSQFSSRLPDGAQYILDSYLDAVPGEVMLTTVTYARDHELFTADMGRSIMHAPIEAHRTSPVLFDGDIIRPIEPNSHFAFPVQELWCVTLTRNYQSDDYYFLGRHENLYGSTWVLYQSHSGVQAAQTVGCDPL